MSRLLSGLAGGLLSPAGALGPELAEPLRQALPLLDLDGGSLWLVSELVALAPKLSEDEAHLLERGLLALLAAEQRGSTRLRLFGEATGEADGLLEQLGVDAEGRARLRALLGEADRLAPLLAGPDGPARPLLRIGEALCLRRTHRAEEALAAHLRARLGPAATGETATAILDPDTTRALAALEALDEAAARAAVDEAVDEAPAGGPALTDEQRAACTAALCRPLTVITGGPGTGKTTIVATLLRALERRAPEVLPALALTAPTGKAADRLDQVLGASRPAGLEAATTLHRLLGYRPRGDRFLHHPHNPLPAALVICDEASMIDLSLMERLLKALLPGARLLLLGDADQLPPVGAGAVLRDLCAAPAATAAVQRLAQSHRQSRADPGGAAILRAATALREGDPAILLDPAAALVTPRASAAALTFSGAEHLPATSEAERRAFFSAWATRHLDPPAELAGRLSSPLALQEGGRVDDPDGSLRALLAHHERSRILCLTRIPAGGAGTTAVNAAFERRLAATLGQAPDPLAPGTPVMVTRNDYHHGLFNGDAGLILRARGPEGQILPVALFLGPEGPRAFSLGALADHLEPAWAITVHKAQGSEFESVAILLPTVEVRLLSREILYTALTRARRSVVLVGPGSALETSALVAPIRQTGLAALLAGP